MHVYFGYQIPWTTRYACVHIQSAISTPFFECRYAQTPNIFIDVLLKLSHSSDYPESLVAVIAPVPACCARYVDCSSQSPKRSGAVKGLSFPLQSVSGQDVWFQLQFQGQDSMCVPQAVCMPPAWIAAILSAFFEWHMCIHAGGCHNSWPALPQIGVAYLQMLAAAVQHQKTRCDMACHQRQWQGTPHAND
jgi:hypothetical protein